MNWRVLALACVLGLLGWVALAVAVAAVIALYQAAPGAVFALAIVVVFAGVFNNERRVKARNDARRQRMRDDALRRAGA